MSEEKGINRRTILKTGLVAAAGTATLGVSTGERSKGSAAELARKWVELYNDGTPETYGSDRFTELYAPEVDWVEYPTRNFPSGRSGNREDVRKLIPEANKLLCDRKMELKQIVEKGDVAAWTGIWSATITVDGLEWPKGSRIRLQLAIFIEVHNDLIVKQHEYVSHAELV